MVALERTAEARPCVPLWSIRARTSPLDDIVERRIPRVCAAFEPPVPLELRPSFHHNVARIEFTLLIAMITSGLFARDHTSLTPGEVIKVPEGVSGEDSVPDGE